ncbi:MAG: hypothetical protein U1F30_08960 [Steroidobacteraceae bacterium]
MLAGQFSRAGGALVFVLYFAALVLAFTALAKSLERRGVRFYRRPGDDRRRPDRGGV